MREGEVGECTRGARSLYTSTLARVDGVPDLSAPSYLYLYVFLSFGVRIRSKLWYSSLRFVTLHAIFYLLDRLFVLVAEALVEDP